MKLESKFKPGDKVFCISIDDHQNIAKISIDIIESVAFLKNGDVRYWTPSCDWAFDENEIIAYNDKELVNYLKNNLKVNK